MRFLALIPAAIAIMGVALISVLHPAHAREMILACDISGGVTLAATCGIVFAQRSSLITVVQVALGASVGQMMLTAMAALIVWAGQLTNDFRSFALWLLVFYWVQLLVMLSVSIRVIRSADTQGKEPAVKCL
jgi:hypothetical protein